MGNITRSWPQGLVLFLQQKRTMPRRNDEAMSTLKNNKQKRINAAAAPDALKVSA
jgi:hypothetical protein